jgi:tetrahydromethanopterin S-methyltransferase subunit C
MDWARISILKLGAIALWCLALVVVGDFTPQQGIMSRGVIAML